MAHIQFSRKDGGHTPEGRIYNNMMSRCKFGGVYLDAYTTYHNCYVVEEFKDFQFFAEWCNKQIGFNNKDANGKVWGLDKDLLERGNRKYGPNVCVFLPQQLNTFLVFPKDKGRELPLGVYKHNNGYRASINNPFTKKLVKKNFSNPDKAFQFYKETKVSYAKELAELYKDLIDPRAYSALSNFIVMPY